MRWITLVTTFSFVFALTALADNDPDNPNGKAYFLAKPACDSYKCEVKVHPGDTLPIEWLNPGKGKIAIYFNPEEGEKDLKRYTIKDKISSHNNKDKCDPEGQKGCGSFDWTIPKDIKPGKYSVELAGISDKNMHSYSDIVTVLSGTKDKRKFKRVLF